MNRMEMFTHLRSLYPDGEIETQDYWYDMAPAWIYRVYRPGPDGERMRVDARIAREE